MRKLLWALLVTCTIACAQSGYLTYDYDEHIAVGVTNWGGFGISLIDSAYTDVMGTTTIYGDKVLTYGGAVHGGAGTTFPGFYLDGDVYHASPLIDFGGDSLRPSAVSIYRTENILVADWYIGEVQFTQTLRPYNVDGNGSVTIRYDIINNDDVPHEVGVILYLDTNIDGSDLAPFAFPGEEAIETTTVFPADDLPPYWSIYEHGPDYEGEQIIARCAMEAVPDFVAIGNQRDLTASVYWDLDVIERLYIEDGLAILRWGEVTIPAHGFLSFSTNYGLAPAGDFLTGPLGARIEMPRKLEISYCELMPNPLSSGVVFRNNTDSTMYDINAWIEFEDTTVLVTPDPTHPIHIADELFPSGLKTAAWRINFSEPPSRSTYKYYTVNATWRYFDETVNIEYPGSIYVEGCDYVGPVATALYPTNATFTSDSIQPIAVHLTDADTVVLGPSVRMRFLSAVGDTLPYTITTLFPGVTFSGDTFRFDNPSTRVDGDAVNYIIVPTYDGWGCPVTPINVRYTHDLTPPMLVDYWPLTDTVLTDSLARPWYFVRDNISMRIKKSSVNMSMTDDFGAHALRFTDTPTYLNMPGDTILYIDPALASTHFPDGDVDIVLTSICDSMDYGHDNCATFVPTTISFTMNSHGPRAYPRSPMPGMTVSCDTPELRFFLYDGNDIDLTSVLFTVNGATYATPWDFMPDDSIVYLPGTGPFTHGTTVNVVVATALDALGTSLDMGSTTSWSYVIDLEAPVIELTSSASVAVPQPIVTFTVTDAPAGVVESTIAVIVDGTAFTLADAALTFAGGTLTWNAATAGMTLASGTHTFEVTAQDDIDICDANSAREIFYIDVVLEAPVVEIASRMPFLCESGAAVDAYIYDGDGVDESSIVVTVDGVSYTVDDPELSFDAAENLLTFDGVVATPCATVEFCVAEVADIFGNALAEPYCLDFLADYAEPQITGVEELVYTTPHYPEPGTLDSAAFVFSFENACGQIVEDEVAVSIYNDYGLLVAEFTTLADPEIVDFDLAGGEVVFTPGAAFEFAAGTHYDVCVYIPELCGFGWHEAGDSCYTYSATKIAEQTGTQGKITRSFLNTNYPDPFNSATVIPLVMHKDGWAKVQITDLSGKAVKVLLDDIVKGGETRLSWDGTDESGVQLPSGVYLAKLVTADSQHTMRIHYTK